MVFTGPQWIASWLGSRPNGSVAQLSRKQKTRAHRAATKRAQRRTAAYRDETSHVHLQLHRDVQTGLERLVLKAPIFQDAWQNARP